MADTEATIQARLDAVNAEIDTIIADTDGKALSYSIEGIKVDKASRLTQLRGLRKDLIEELAMLPAEEETVVDEPWL